jgi:(2R)-3-sulfolactate dehydrogenase (NADP+)
MIAAKEGRSIPLGWALDRDGNPTTDAKAALTGSMLALGGTKGAMLALIVELLACALTGAAFGFEADSFFVDEGNRPNLGQAFLVIDPGAFAGRDVYLSRVESLIDEMVKDAGVRLPGARRRELAERNIDAGITISETLAAELERLARYDPTGPMDGRSGSMR